MIQRKFYLGVTMPFIIFFILFFSIRAIYKRHKARIDPFIKLAVFAAVLAILITGHGK